MYASVIKREQAKLDGSKKPEKCRKIVAPKSESDDEMSVQVICAPQKISKKKTTINTLDVSAEEMDYKNVNQLPVTADSCHTNTYIPLPISSSCTVVRMTNYSWFSSVIG